MEWVNKNHQPARKDIPILIWCMDDDKPNLVEWVDTPIFLGFYEINMAFGIDEENFIYWMPAPKKPECKE